MSTREAKVVTKLLLFLVAIYASVSVYLNGLQSFTDPNYPGAFWSPDSGARFAMIYSWVTHGRMLHLYYPAAPLDPTGQIHPLAYFLFHQPHGFCAMYPPLFPLIAGTAYRAFGFGGLTIVPIVSGLGCVFITYMTACRLNMEFRIFIPLVVGTATPLVLYSSVFWDHSFIMLVMAGVGYWMLRSIQERSFCCGVIAGATIGLGIWVHELFLACFVAVWLALLPLLKSHRYIVTGLPVGFLIVILSWGVFNWLVYGAFGGPHLGANVTQNNNDHPFDLARILDWTQFNNRVMAQVVGTAIVDVAPNLWPYYLIFACLLIVYTFVAWSGDVMAGLMPTIGLSAAGVALLLVIRIHAYASPAGLFEATPLLIPALAVPWWIQKTQSGVLSIKMFYAWLSRTCWLVVLFLLINPMRPGTDWGSRYLLSVLPLLSLLAAHALEQQYRNIKTHLRGLMVVNSCGLIGISCLCQLYGLIWVHRNLAYSQQLNRSIRAIVSPILVTNADMPARLAYPVPSQMLFLVRTDEDGKVFSSVLRQTKVPELTFVGTGFGDNIIENAIVDSGRSYTKSEVHPLFLLSNSEEGDELQVIRFILRPKDQVKNAWK